MPSTVGDLAPGKEMAFEMDLDVVVKDVHCSPFWFGTAGFLCFRGGFYVLRIPSFRNVSCRVCSGSLGRWNGGRGDIVTVPILIP